ncbi:DUF1801 domain-containing protein [Aquibium oceanicum]|uniref:YdhG-like domain-containing protein n=1 Tax=Aquibium oceanicum TaxID=1670800 RepID=A0A1L3SRA3_9HYPH|nr:DUF1801 domain-containing protein [Aquibium oceanicum]APH71934.1 hypothetical protein BSQ44_11605 [Aquibium oceanicum]
MTAAPSPEVAEVFARMPEPIRDQALALRALVQEAAASIDGVKLVETLKWGEPAYLPGRAGTTVRIGWDRSSGDVRLLVNCQTTLVEHWRTRFDGRLAFEGNRAVVVPVAAPLDVPALRACIADALTYHASKRRN